MKGDKRYANLRQPSGAALRGRRNRSETWRILAQYLSWDFCIVTDTPRS